VDLARRSYAPLMWQKPAELIAVEKLSAVERELLLPVFRFRPWLTSLTLKKSIDRLQIAVSGSLCGCVIDEIWQPGDLERPATTEFKALRDNPSRRKFFDFVLEHENLVPCFYPKKEVFDEIIKDAEVTDRGFGIIVEIENFAQVGGLIDGIRRIDHNNYFIVIDCAWSKNPVGFLGASEALTKSILEVNEAAVVFISGSSFPESFAHLGESAKSEVKEIELFEKVRANIQKLYNRSDIRYSDWATTRKPQKGGGIGKPRIDLPRGRFVEIRRTETLIGYDAYTKLAKDLFDEFPWSETPKSWGHNCLEKTRIGAAGGISDAAKNTAARVNIHLHETISRLNDGMPMGAEEPFDL
jgi:hypothetical protein